MVEERDGNYINLYRWKVSIPILPKIGEMKHILMTVSILLVLWGIAEAVYGGLQLYGLAESNHSLYNITGSFRNPGPYAGFLAVVLPVALYLALSCRIRNKCLRQGTVALCWVYVFLCATLLPATLSRAAWIAACVGCGIVLCARYRLRARCILYFRRHRRRAWAWLSAACLLLALAGMGAYYLKKDSADGRLLMWKVTARVVADAPYTGVGPGRFAGAYGEAQVAYFASGKGTAQEKHVAGSPEYAFNEFLGIAAERGFPFLVYCLLLLVFAFRCAGRGRQWGIAGGLAAFLAFSCFSYPLSVWQHRLLFLALVVLAFGSWSPRGKWRSRGWHALLWAFFALIVLAGARQAREKRQAEERWQEEQTYYQMEIYEGTVDNYRRLYRECPVLRQDPRFLFEYGQCLSKTKRYGESNSILFEGSRLSSDPMFWNIMGKNYQAMHAVEEAEACFRKAYDMVPNRLYPLYLLANLYFSTGEAEKGVAVARQLLDQEPKVMSDAVREMKAEMKEKIGRYGQVAP